MECRHMAGHKAYVLQKRRYLPGNAQGRTDEGSVNVPTDKLSK